MRLTRDEMDRTPRCRSDKFHNINCGYAMVRDKVFCSIREAEVYCYKNSIDMNTWIRADDPKVLKECKTIVKVSLPLLEIMFKTLHDKWEANRTIIESRAERRDNLQSLADKGDLGASWDLDSAKNELTEAIWTGHGLYEAMEEVRDQITDYRKILNIREEQI